MRKRRNWSKRLLAGMLSAAMVALNISTATPAFAAPSAEEYREAKEKKAEDLTAGSARWGTPSNAAKVLHTQLDGVEIEVSAPAGVLPEGATLKARKLSEEEEKEVLEKINEHAEAAGKTATTQFLCDLTVLNAAGEPIQPDNAKGTLAVSFRNIAIVSAASAWMRTCRFCRLRQSTSRRLRSSTIRRANRRSALALSTSITTAMRLVRVTSSAM